MIPNEKIESEYARFLDTMLLTEKFSGERMTEADARAYSETKLLITGAMRRGTLTIDDDGHPVLAPTDGSERLTFHEHTGAGLSLTDRVPKGRDIEKQNGLLGALTKQKPARFDKMLPRDYRVCLALLVLMLVA